jgi:20S proteasome alpha/beta subunit
MPNNANLGTFLYKEMTCTIGYIDGNVVVMGCDSAATDEDGAVKIRKGCTKVWKIDDYIVGFCGNFPELMVLRHVFKWPKRKHYETIEHWLISKVYKSICEQFQDKPEISWTLLFGFAKPGRLIVLDQNGDLEECEENFAVIGSAERFAVGSLKTLENNSMYSWEKIETALDIAATYDNSVRKPMHINVLIN